MTDKEYNADKKRVKKLIKKWISKLGLGWYNIKFEHERQNRVDESVTEYAPKSVNGYWQSAMVTTCDHYYGTASITCYHSVTQSLSDKELEETFLHELMHIFLAPIHTKKLSKEEEQVATRLALAFRWSQE